MATYVLAHGGGHGGWCRDHTVPLLDCTGKLATRPDAARRRWIGGDPVREIGTGRDLMIAEPRKLADMPPVLA